MPLSTASGAWDVVSAAVALDLGLDLFQLQQHWFKHMSNSCCSFSHQESCFNPGLMYLV